MGRFIFPSDAQVGDSIDLGFHRFTYDAFGRWRRTMISITEIRAQAEEAAAAEAQAAAEQEAAASIAAAEAAQEEALAAKEAALTAASDAEATVTNLVQNAPAELDSFLEVANAITKTTITNKTASFTIVQSNANQLLQCNSASAITVTVPNDAAIPVGTEIAFMRQGAGTVTFAASGVTIQSAGSKLSIKDQYGTAALMKVSDTVWLLSGNLE